jgi:hypothetical protein
MVKGQHFNAFTSRITLSASLSSGFRVIARTTM